MSQIKMGELASASKLLQELSQLDGDDESEAQTRFLLGWIHLSENQVPEARKQLLTLIERYPGATAATSAQQVLQRLEAAP